MKHMEETRGRPETTANLLRINAEIEKLDVTPVADANGITPGNKDGGRPSKMTPQTIAKLELAFSYGASDYEACYFANISPTTLYEYQKLVPGFAEKKKMLKSAPILLAKEAVVGAFKKRPELALRYLEDRLPNEFNSKPQVNVSVDNRKYVIVRGSPGTEKPPQDIPAQIQEPDV